MLASVQQRLGELQATAERLDRLLSRPGAEHLPGLAVARVAVLIDAAAAKLSRQLAALDMETANGSNGSDHEQPGAIGAEADLPPSLKPCTPPFPQDALLRANHSLAARTSWLPAAAALLQPGQHLAPAAWAPSAPWAPPPGPAVPAGGSPRSS